MKLKGEGGRSPSPASHRSRSRNGHRGLCRRRRAGRRGVASAAAAAVCLQNRAGLGLRCWRAALDQTLCFVGARGHERGPHPAPVLPRPPSCRTAATQGQPAASTQPSPAWPGEGWATRRVKNCSFNVAEARSCGRWKSTGATAALPRADGSAQDGAARGSLLVFRSLRAESFVTPGLIAPVSVEITEG